MFWMKFMLCNKIIAVIYWWIFSLSIIFNKWLKARKTTLVHSYLTSWWEVSLPPSLRLALHPSKLSNSDFKMLMPWSKPELSKNHTEVSEIVHPPLFVMKELRLSGKEMELTSSDISPLKHSTSLLRTTLRDCSAKANKKMDISYGSSVTLLQEVLLDQSHSCSSIPSTMPEPDFPMILSQPKREDKSNSLDSLMFTEKLSLLMD